MTRIDAALATQVGETQRPAQSAQDVQLQAAAAQSQSVAQPTTKPVSADDLRAAAAQLKEVVEKASGRRLNFKVDDTTGEAELCVQVQDASTGEVVAQIPSQEILKMQANLSQMVGMIFDKKA